jgi:hypothetical protein
MRFHCATRQRARQVLALDAASLQRAAAELLDFTNEVST